MNEQQAVIVEFLAPVRTDGFRSIKAKESVKGLYFLTYSAQAAFVGVKFRCL